MQRRLLLDVVVGERAAVLELLAGKDQALLVGRDALLVLDLFLDDFHRVRRVDVERDGLARERLDKDLERRVALCCRQRTGRPAHKHKRNERLYAEFLFVRACRCRFITAYLCIPDIH